MSDEITIEPADPTPRPWRYVVGVDLALLSDFTSVTVSRVLRRPTIRWRQVPFGDPPTQPHRAFDHIHEVVELVRPPHGTPYPRVANLVAQILTQLPPLETAPLLVTDATGVGLPVMSMMCAEGLSPIAVTITGGTETNWHGPLAARVPKRVLVSGLQVVLQSERLRIARDLTLAEVLAEELTSFRAKISAAGRESFEGEASTHDDTVMSTALAVWAGEIRPRRPLVRRAAFNLFSRL